MARQKAPTQEYESEENVKWKIFSQTLTSPSLGPSQKPLGTSCLEQANAFNL